jgi:hypothetical protein
MVGYGASYFALELTLCSIQDALRLFMPPLKSDEARTDFYTVYKRESIEHDTNYVKKYEEDLNTTLVFVGLAMVLVLGGADPKGY